MDPRTGLVLFGAGFVALYVIFFSLAPTVQPDGPSRKYCETAADCVPAQCCHPTSAVNERYAPDCRGEFCTEECRAGTLDCQQGEIRCVDNTCTVVINNPLSQQ